MCGIIGYTGSEEAENVLVGGLSSLEYRGYDSAGISVSYGGGMVTVKSVGRVSALRQKLLDMGGLKGTCGLGHTRWATHGAPSELNSHPHSSGYVTLVHNGIVENCEELKQYLVSLGYEFSSETDTECIAHLLDRNYSTCFDPVSAIRETLLKIQGSYALGIIFGDKGEDIYAVRKDNPLIVAKGERGFYLSSDVTAISEHTKTMYRLRENEIVRLSPCGCFFYSFGGDSLNREFTECEQNSFGISKNGYEYFMLKEMHEQPDAVKNTVCRRLNSSFLPDLSIDGIPDSVFEKIDSVTVVGCGSAVNAGLAGKRIMEALAKIPVSVVVASEFRYSEYVSCGKTLTVCISQSGETADTLAALRYAKANGSVTLSIVNAVNSSIAYESDYLLYTNAGPEISVATTKGYMTQVALMAILAAKISLVRDSCDRERIVSFCEELSRDIPERIRAVLNGFGSARVPEKLQGCENVFFIGRGNDLPAVTEGSLKLKEISYIHSEAYAAGELKHGTLSLITCGTPVLALATDQHTYEKTLANAREVKSRGGYLILVCDEGLGADCSFADVTVSLPHADPLLTPFVSVTYLQCVAYETTVRRGLDVDHPRNLAKSVTVE